MADDRSALAASSRHARSRDTIVTKQITARSRASFEKVTSWRAGWRRSLSWSRRGSRPGSMEFQEELREGERHARPDLWRHQSDNAAREHDRRQRELHLDVRPRRYPAGAARRSRSANQKLVDIGRSGRRADQGAERASRRRTGRGRRSFVSTASTHQWSAHWNTTRHSKRRRIWMADTLKATPGGRSRARASVREMMSEEEREQQFDLLTAALLGLLSERSITLIFRTGPSGRRPIAPLHARHRQGRKVGGTRGTRGATMGRRSDRAEAVAHD